MPCRPFQPPLVLLEEGVGLPLFPPTGGPCFRVCRPGRPRHPRASLVEEGVFRPVDPVPAVPRVTTGSSDQASLPPMLPKFSVATNPAYQLKTLSLRGKGLRLRRIS